MKIVHIFADKLFAIQYDDEEIDELERLFDEWQDLEYLENFFEEHKADLKSGFYSSEIIENAVLNTFEEAKSLRTQLDELSEYSLESLFKPLDNLEYRSVLLSKRKAYGNRHKSWLRLYAIRIEKDMYVITGGAIKLTSSMDERLHTQKELNKLEKCRNWLKEEGLINPEAFTELET